MAELGHGGSCGACWYQLPPRGRLLAHGLPLSDTFLLRKPVVGMQTADSDSAAAAPLPLHTAVLTLPSISMAVHPPPSAAICPLAQPQPSLPQHGSWEGGPRRTLCALQMVVMVAEGGQERWPQRQQPLHSLPSPGLTHGPHLAFTASSRLLGSHQQVSLSPF